MSLSADALDETTAGIAVWNADGALAFVTRAFLNSFPLGGQAREELTFRRFLALVAGSNELVLPQDPQAWIAVQEARFGREQHFELAMADGRTLQVTQKPSGAGGMTTTVHDVSAMKRVEFALRQAVQEAADSGEAKSRFLRAANHDLRQPLATLRILIFSCMNETSADDRKDLLHAMDLSVSIMEDLLGALLQIGQLDAGQVAARVTTFQLAQLFERLKVQFGHQAAEKGLSLRFAPCREAVVSDKALLERILSNLLANAIRYTGVGGVLVGCRRRGGRLAIQVWDSGRGIEVAHIDRIFDEFYQAPDARQSRRQGLGLGLNIVKRLAALLHHPVSVRSVPGRGSVFEVELPCGDVWQSDLGEPEISEMIGGEFAGIPILLIEDDDVLRRATEELLARWGVKVSAASSEAEARGLIEAGGVPPRLIIADYSLRGQFGTEAIRAVRAALTCDVPAIVVTADVDPAVTDRIAAEGFSLLIKPVSPPRLRVMMHSLLFEPASQALPAEGPVR